MIVYFYLPDGLSGVTQYYVNIVIDAVKRIGKDVVIKKHVKDIPLKSNVVTIRDKDSYYVYLLRNPKVLITWFQGIAPEEIALNYKKDWNCRVKVLLHRLFERQILKHGNLNLFVSEAMLEHYRTNYSYDSDEYFIMPCFGNTIDASAFMSDKYKQPKFLYSGSITEWQCIDKMLIMFKQIKSEIPQATLSILTPDMDIAKKMLTELDVEASIDFVNPSELQSYIKQFKYGFIIREDININQVATPTKLSNYMGAGVIPVYSDVVLDYKKNITTKSDFVIAISDFDDCISKIKAMERRLICSEEILQDYSKIFNSYWNRDKYVDLLSKKISKLL